MNLYSVKNNPELCEKVKLYCNEKWEKIYQCFAEAADKSVDADTLPQTWVILGMEGEKEILGFYQLIHHESLTCRTDLSPFVASLYVDERVRGYGYGELILNHAKYEAARLNFKKLYIASDHIGYYEKYGFREIGLDTCTWGRAAKIYVAYAYSHIRYEVYSRKNPIPDHIRLEHAKFLRGEIKGNPAKLLWQSKKCSPIENNPAKWFSIAAFSNNSLVGWVNFMQNPDKLLNWYLGDLAVAPSLRRKGIARRMLDMGISIIRSKASGGEFVYSYIEKNNTPSLCLHKSLGFIDTGELKPFRELNFGDNETTHILYLDNV